MNKKIALVCAILVIILFLVFPFVAFSQTVGQLGIHTNYLWRGQTFSNNQPAVQLEVEQDFGAIYVGTFISNATWNDPSRDTMTHEVDAIIGKKFTGKDWELNLSHTHLFFPGAGAFDSDESAAQFKYKRTLVRFSQMYNYFGYNSIYRYSRIGQEWIYKEGVEGGFYLSYNSFTNTHNAGNTNYGDVSLVTRKTLENGSAISFTVNETNRKLYTDTSKVKAKDFMFIVGYTVPFSL